MNQTSTIQVEWLLASVVAAGGRFVPVPIVDDVLRDQADAFVVRRTLNARGVASNAALVAALRGRKGGLLRGALGLVLGLPLKVLLYPIRKIVKVLGAARGIPRDAVRPVVLGRATQRVIDLGWLGEDPTSQSGIARARTAGQAFEKTWKRFDGGPLASAIADTLRATPELASSAYRLALELARGRSGDAEAAQAPPPDSLPRGFDKLFADFDQAFDAALEEARI